MSLIPQPTIEEQLQCQFSSWYDQFRSLSDYHRTNVTIKSIIIPLPPEFVDYLLSDGVVLPLEATDVSSCLPPEHQQHDDWSDNDDSEDEVSQERVSFPKLTARVLQAIEALGGQVMPKLNWSAPKDATWIGSLKCSTPGDIYLLLKSSDFCWHDVSFEKPADFEYTLVLRKWCNLNPSMEFRCFVKERELVAISQRQHTQHFEHLQNHREQITLHIIDFFHQVVQARFPLSCYCFDIYLDKKDRIWILDFNVWGTQTDSLLWEWNELALQSKVELRLVEHEREIRHDPLASYRAPIDTISLAGAKNFEQFMAMCSKPSDMDNCD